MKSTVMPDLAPFPELLERQHCLNACIDADLDDAGFYDCCHVCWRDCILNCNHNYPEGDKRVANCQYYCFREWDYYLK